MRKWYRLFPTVLVVGAIVGMTQLPRILGQASPGVRTSYKALALPVKLPVASGYTTVDAFADAAGGGGLTFDQPLDVQAAPGEKDRLFVVEKTGKIWSVSGWGKPAGSEGAKKTLFLDVPKMLQAKGWQLGTQVEWGVLGIAFHPNYAANGYFYITYDFTVPEDGRNSFNRLARFSVSKTNPNEADPASEVPLITQLDLAPNHNGGCVRFGQDGYLYYGMGDEGNANDSFDNARWIDKDFFAAIYRLDVDNKPENLPPNGHKQNSTAFPSAVNAGAYKIPADNPFVGLTTYFGRTVDPAKVRTEIYAAGMRNPWRFSFDAGTGRLLVADVGQDRWEELDIVTKGGNYGWSYKEALHDGPRIGTMPPEAKLLEPVYEYGHGLAGNFTGNSISGGFIYRGTKLAELTGAYIFGDYVSKRVWALREKDGKWTPTLLATNVGNVGFYPDPGNGDVLLADLAAGKVRRLVRTGVQGPQPPALLSQVGAFKDLKTLTPADGLVAYTPNVSFWSDYAIKERWFIIPNGADTIGFNAAGSWNFPAGMVWVKHFEMEMKRGDASSRRRLETRFLVKTGAGPGGGVYGITYKWRADGSDADLVPESGLDEVLQINDGGTMKAQTWHYPSQSECLTCHTEVAGEALGFNTPQLNGMAGGTNQIEALSHAGYLSGAIPEVAGLTAYAAATNTAASVEWRVRSYLAVNCIQCHQPGGVAQGQWEARAATATSAAGLLNGPLVNNRGDTAARVIVPGDLAHSMLLRRVEGRDSPRMPPLSTNEVDPGAKALLSEWIEALPRQ